MSITEIHSLEQLAEFMGGVAAAPQQAIVFKPTDSMALPTHCRATEADAKDKATRELVAGCYRMVCVTPDMADAEAVFDHVNLETPVSMNPGDVIVWADGRRELCLSNGWAAI